MGDINTNIRIDDLEKIVENIDDYLSTVGRQVENLAKNPVITMVDLEFSSSVPSKTYTGSKIRTFFQALHRKDPCVMFLLDTTGGNRYQITNFEEVSENGEHFNATIHRFFGTQGTHYFTKLEFVKTSSTEWTLYITDLT